MIDGTIFQRIRSSQDNKNEFCYGISNSSTKTLTNVIALACGKDEIPFFSHAPSSSKPSSKIGFPFHFVLISYHHPVTHHSPHAQLF